MLAVISSPHSIQNEAGIINSLFKAGLFHFHLRKPNASLQELRVLLQAVDHTYYQRIALHQYHALALEMGITRLHFTESARIKTDKMLWRELIATGFKLSTSLHDIETGKTLSSYFSYAFLGPVFNSISKQGYVANTTLIQSTQLANITVPLIAIGGIDKHNCTKPMRLGFRGVAALGSIWQSNNPVESFLHLKEQYSGIPANSQT